MLLWSVVLVVVVVRTMSCVVMVMVRMSCVVKSEHPQTVMG